MKNLKKLDGSFNITVNGMPYNTCEGNKYYSETLELYNSNPELFDEEVQPTEKSISYKTLRSNEYPTIEEQLDMIYWDKNNGTNNWFSKISEIKAKYPKNS